RRCHATESRSVTSKTCGAISLWHAQTLPPPPTHRHLPESHKLRLLQYRAASVLSSAQPADPSGWQNAESNSPQEQSPWRTSLEKMRYYRSFLRLFNLDAIAVGKNDSPVSLARIPITSSATT